MQPSALFQSVKLLEFNPGGAYACDDLVNNRRVYKCCGVPDLINLTRQDLPQDAAHDLA